MIELWCRAEIKELCYFNERVSTVKAWISPLYHYTSGTSASSGLSVRWYYTGMSSGQQAVTATSTRWTYLVSHSSISLRDYFGLLQNS